MDSLNDDLRVLAVEAATLVIALRSKSPDAVPAVHEATRSLPDEVTDVLETLGDICESLGKVRYRKQELEALTYKITYVTACVIIKRQLAAAAAATATGTTTTTTINTTAVATAPASWKNQEIDFAPLTECVEAVGKIVRRTRRRGRVSIMLTAASGGSKSRKRSITELHGRVDELTRELGLAGIVAVFKGVLLGAGSDTAEVLSKDQVLMAQQAQVSRQATVPTLTPPRREWHVSRQRVMDMVSNNLFQSHEQPQVVGVVGESGSGKTIIAAEIVRSAQVLEFFADGVIWLSVDEGAASRLPSLMLELARMVRGEIVGGDSSTPAGASSKSSENTGVEDGASYVRDAMAGNFSAGRGPLRCLVVADNVWEKEVTARLRDTGMWVLVTTSREDAVRSVGGKPVRINRMFGADAELLLKRASGLPEGVGWQEGARDLVELCGRVALDVAYVGRWSTIREGNHATAWSRAADTIRFELQNPPLTWDTLSSDPSKDEPCVMKGNSGETVSLSLESEMELIKDDARATRRSAVLRAGFRALVDSSRGSRVQELFLSLAVMPDGHEFALGDAAILLGVRVGDDFPDEEEEVRAALHTLERCAIVTAREETYHMHDVHLGFAREVLAGRSDVRRLAVERWTSFISSLNTILTVDPHILAQLWSAVERVGGEGWRATRPYERALTRLDGADPRYRAGIETVAKFRKVDGEWAGASAMWQHLLALEQQREEAPDVRYLLKELVEAAEKRGAGTEAMFGLRDIRQAERMLRRVLKAEKSCPKPDEVLVRQALFHLGLCLRQGRRLRAAEGCLRQALDMEKDTSAPCQLHVARSLYELGLCLRLMGRLDEAERLLLRCLTIWHTRLGSDDQTVAHTLDELGACARQAGRHLDAEVYLRRALKIKTIFAVEPEPRLSRQAANKNGQGDSVARTMFQLALCVMLSGRQREAEGLLRNVLAIEETRAGKEEAAVGRILFHLGVCLYRGGRKDEAELLFRRALVTLKAKLGQNNEEVAAVEQALDSYVGTE